MGYRSWYELAQKVGTADQLAAKHGKDTFKAQVKWNDGDTAERDIVSTGMEIFECDVMTLKMRAFDELNKLIPDTDTLIKMLHDYHLGQSKFTPLPPEDHSTSIFLKNLLKLKR